MTNFEEPNDAPQSYNRPEKGPGTTAEFVAANAWRYGELSTAEQYDTYIRNGMTPPRELRDAVVAEVLASIADLPPSSPDSL